MADENSKPEKPKTKRQQAIDAAAQARRENDALALSSSTRFFSGKNEQGEDDPGIFKIAGARAKRDLEVKLTRPLGVFGEGIMNARRAASGEKLSAFGKTLKNAFAARISGSRYGIVGEVWSNKIFSSLSSWDDDNLPQRFNQIASAMGQELGVVQLNFNNVNKMFEAVGKQFDKVGEDLKKINENVKLIKAEKKDNIRVKRIQEKFFEKEMKIVDARFKLHTDNIDRLDLNFHNIEERIDKFESLTHSELDEIHSRLDNMEGDNGIKRPRKRERTKTRKVKLRNPKNSRNMGRSMLSDSKKVGYENSFGRFGNAAKSVVGNIGGNLSKSLGGIGSAAGTRLLAGGARYAAPVLLGLAGAGLQAWKLYDTFTKNKPLDRQNQILNKQKPIEGQGNAPGGIVPEKRQPSRNIRNRGNDLSSLLDRRAIEEQKKRFMMFGELPSGFEFLEGNRGRLGMPASVAAGGAQPLSGDYGVSRGPGGPTGFNQGPSFDIPPLGTPRSGMPRNSSPGQPITGSPSQPYPTNSEISPNISRTGITIALQEQRRRLFERLDENPALKRKFMAIAANEQGTNPEGIQAIMESLINRAIVRGGGVEGGLKRLEKEIRFTSEGGYYEDTRGQQRAWSTINNVKNIDIFNQAYENVRSGSNISNFGYGNASAGVAARKMDPRSRLRAERTFYVNGETIFGPNSDERLYIKNYSIWKKQIADRASQIGDNELPPLQLFKPQASIKPTSGEQPIFVGDSVARGLAKNSKSNLDLTQEGIGPAEILRRIKSTDPAMWKGKTVVLSSGLLNAPGIKLDDIENQIKYLKDAGANVRLVGGPNSKVARTDLNGVNDSLQKIAEKHGIPFLGDYQSQDGVHPNSYKNYGILPNATGSTPQSLFFDSNKPYSRSRIDEIVKQHGTNAIIGQNHLDDQSSLAYARQKGLKTHWYMIGAGEPAKGYDGKGVKFPTDQKEIEKNLAEMNMTREQWDSGGWLEWHKKKLLEAKQKGTAPDFAEFDSINNHDPETVGRLISDFSKWRTENQIGTQLVPKNLSKEYYAKLDELIKSGAIDKNALAPYQIHEESSTRQQMADARTWGNQRNMATFQTQNTHQYQSPNQGFMFNPGQTPIPGIQKPATQSFPIPSQAVRTNPTTIPDLLRRGAAIGGVGRIGESTFQGLCGKGTRGVVGALLNDPYFRQGLSIGGNNTAGSLSTNNNYLQQSGFYQNRLSVGKEKLTKEYLDSLPIGTVISSAAYNGAGHVQVKLANGTWASDAVQKTVLTGSKYHTFAVHIPNQEGFKKMDPSIIGQHGPTLAAMQNLGMPVEVSKQPSEVKPAMFDAQIINQQPSDIISTEGAIRPDLPSDEPLVRSKSTGTEPIPTTAIPQGTVANIKPTDVGFDEKDAVPVTGLQTIGGVTAPQAAPELPDYSTMVKPTVEEQGPKQETQPASPPSPTQEPTTPSGPRTPSRFNPETQAPTPGTSGFGSQGRCFVAINFFLISNAVVLYKYIIQNNYIWSLI